jgi:hypothetical protein
MTGAAAEDDVSASCRLSRCGDQQDVVQQLPVTSAHSLLTLRQLLQQFSASRLLPLIVYCYNTLQKLL